MVIRIIAAATIDMNAVMIALVANVVTVATSAVGGIVTQGLMFDRFDISQTFWKSRLDDLDEYDAQVKTLENIESQIMQASGAQNFEPSKTASTSLPNDPPDYYDEEPVEDDENIITVCPNCGSPLENGICPNERCDGDES
jgi:hypothetical protein